MKTLMQPFPPSPSHYVKSLGFVKYKDDMYVIVRSYVKGRPSEKYLQVLARVVRERKPQATIPDKDRADASKNEKALVHFPVASGAQVFEWHIVNDKEARLTYADCTYCVIEELKSEDALRMAKGMINNLYLYRKDKYFRENGESEFDKKEIFSGR